MKRPLPGKEGFEEANLHASALIQWAETLTSNQIAGLQHALNGKLRSIWLGKLAPLHQQFFGDDALLFTHVFEPMARAEEITLLLPMSLVSHQWRRLVNRVTHANLLSRRLCRDAKPDRIRLDLFSSLTSLRASDRLAEKLSSNIINLPNQLTSLHSLQSLELTHGDHNPCGGVPGGLRLAWMTSLRRLVFDHWSDQLELADLNQLTTLTELRIDGDMLVDGVSHLTCLTALTALRVTDLRRDEAEFVPALRALTHLESNRALDFSRYCGRGLLVTDKSVDAALEYWKKQGGLKAFARKCMYARLEGEWDANSRFTGDGTIVSWDNKQAYDERPRGEIVDTHYSIYLGAFRENRRHGKGILVERSWERAWIGEWRNGGLEGMVHLYAQRNDEARFVCACWCEAGLMVDPDPTALFVDWEARVEAVFEGSPGFRWEWGTLK